MFYIDFCLSSSDLFIAEDFHTSYLLWVYILFVDIDEDGTPIVELYDTTTSNDVNMSLLLIKQGAVKDLGIIKK